MTVKSPLILLLDGNALIHRAYHAIPPLTSPAGEPTNATFGFTSTLLKVWNELNPDCAIVAFDVGRTFRHEEFSEYKANRPSLPDDLAIQLRRAREVVKAFGLPDESLEGYEADDILATLARSAAEQDMDVIILTGDTDTLQLIGPRVRVLLTGHRVTDTKLYDEASIEERYGLTPKQMVDFKSLKGDPSDNIPGVRGIGPVTATQLLQQFKNLEGIFEHIDEVPPKVRDKLQAAEASLKRSKRLIQLVDDLPIEFDPSRCRLDRYDRERVSLLFRELGFRSLIERLPRGTQRESAQLSMFEPSQSTQMEETAPLGDYRLINTEAALQQLVAEIRQAGLCVVDVETTSVRPVMAELVGLALAYRPGEGYYVPIAHQTPGTPQLPLELVRQHVGPVLLDPAIKKYAHNATYDLIVLHQHGMDVQGLAFDTMIAAYLADPASHNLGLKGCAWQEFGVEMTPIKDLIGTGKSQITMAQVPVDRVMPYAACDADMTLRLAPVYEKRLRERGLWELFTDVEMALVPVLVEMEYTGVAIDVTRLHEMSGELSVRLGELEQQIQSLVGHAININSSQQLSQALFKELGLPTEGVPRGANGRYSTAAEVLEMLHDKHPVIPLILEHRQLSKIKATYLDTLPALVNPMTGRLHTSWNQTGTVTGRLSSSEPNLQNIPIRTDLGKQVREAFVAQPGSVLLGADYSQVELRVLAHLSGDENLLAAFRRGEDIHTSTAASILNVPLDDVTSEMRRVAKTINFGIVYGMSDWGLASRTGLPREEARRFIDNYFERYPRVYEYLSEVKAQAIKTGHVETLLGRKRYFPELQGGGRRTRPYE